MKQESISLHIALAFDNFFLQQFYALATSIFINNPHSQISIHAITSGVTKEEKGRIERFAASHNANILFYGVPSGFGENFVLDGNWTAATYYRLLLPELLPKEIDKFLYIDSDTLVVGNLQPLFVTDISSSYVAAVRDRLVPTRPDLGVTDPFSYFNAGVLLVNRKLWVEQDITRKAIDFLTAFPEIIRYADQDALNNLFNRKWTQLDIKYNLMYADIPEGFSSREYNIFLKDKVIIHFTQQRPWQMLCRNPYRSLYHLYLKKSPFPVKEKYTDFSLKNLPELLKIKLIDLYFDLPYLKVIWRSLKAS